MFYGIIIHLAMWLPILFMLGYVSDLYIPEDFSFWTGCPFYCWPVEFILSLLVPFWFRWRGVKVYPPAVDLQKI